MAEQDSDSEGHRVGKIIPNEMETVMGPLENAVSGEVHPEAEDIIRQVFTRTEALPFLAPVLTF